jgi:hypothetical protein
MGGAGGGVPTGGPGTVFVWSFAEGIKSLLISNGNAGCNQSLITSMAITTGVAWLTESGFTSFDFDEVNLSECGALAINPTDIPANQVVPRILFLLTIVLVSFILLTKIHLSIKNITGDKTLGCSMSVVGRNYIWKIAKSNLLLLSTPMPLRPSPLR